MNNQAYKFFETVTASGGDAVLADHILTIAGLPAVDTRLIEYFKVKAAVAETLGVWTTTPTAAADKTFTLSITQFRPDLGQTLTRVLAYAATSADTATTICNGWRSQLSAFPELKITGSGTTTFIATAQAGYALFTVVSIGTGTAAAVNGTPGVAARNTTAALTLAGFTGGATSATYTSLEIVYRQFATSENVAGNASTNKNRIVAFFNESSNNAGLRTRLAELANGVNVGQAAGGTAAPEFQALGDPATT